MFVPLSQGIGRSHEYERSTDFFSEYRDWDYIGEIKVMASVSTRIKSIKIGQLIAHLSSIPMSVLNPVKWTQKWGK